MTKDREEHEPVVPFTLQTATLSQYSAFVRRPCRTRLTHQDKISEGRFFIFPQYPLCRIRSVLSNPLPRVFDGLLRQVLLSARLGSPHFLPVVSPFSIVSVRATVQFVELFPSVLVFHVLFGLTGVWRDVYDMPNVPVTRQTQSKPFRRSSISCSVLRWCNLPCSAAEEDKQNECVINVTPCHPIIAVSRPDIQLFRAEPKLSE